MKRVRVRLTERSSKLRHTPRYSGIHQVSPDPASDARFNRPTIRILLALENVEHPTHLALEFEVMLCHDPRTRLGSFLTLRLCLVANVSRFLTN